MAEDTVMKISVTDLFSERPHRRRVGSEAAGDCYQAECGGEYSVHADWSRHHSGRNLHVPDVSTENPRGETLMRLCGHQRRIL